jgi:hypothetical protein
MHRWHSCLALLILSMIAAAHRRVFEVHWLFIPERIVSKATIVVICHRACTASAGELRNDTSCGSKCTRTGSYLY